MAGALGILTCALIPFEPDVDVARPIRLYP